MIGAGGAGAGGMTISGGGAGAGGSTISGGWMVMAGAGGTWMTGAGGCWMITGSSCSGSSPIVKERTSDQALLTGPAEFTLTFQ